MKNRISVKYIPDKHGIDQLLKKQQDIHQARKQLNVLVEKVEVMFERMKDESISEDERKKLADDILKTMAEKGDLIIKYFL